MSGSLATLGLTILIAIVVKTLYKAPSLDKSISKGNKELDTSLTVIIPTYNEEENIQRCLSSLLANKTPCHNWKIIIADDNSEDNTIQVAEDILNKTQIKNEIIRCGPRPLKEKWVGKNWPCSQAMINIDSQWILFLDADTRLMQDTLYRAILEATKRKVDLLSLAPRLTCGCIAEWMVQPIMAILLTMGFPISETNDPKKLTAFAAGPFMLFSQHSYNKIGGHKGVSAEVVEDLALAKKIKSSGFKLRFLLGLDALELRMYSDFSALWEGWSKNWCLGLDGSIFKSVGSSIIVFVLFSLPWILIPSITFYMFLKNEITILLSASFLISLLGVELQYLLRLWTRKRFMFPLKYWWLMGVGGLIILIIGPTSAIKTITGRGWTWKGRSLA